MKKMMKSLSVLLAAMALFCLTGCVKANLNVNVNVKPGIQEVKKNSGVMFTAEYRFGGIADEDEYEYIESTEYTVNYDGTMTIVRNYSINGTYTATTTLSDDDLVNLYDMANRSKDNNNFEDYMIDGTDGGIWTFNYYEGGSASPIQLFHGGFAGGNAVLDGFKEILYAYESGATFANENGEGIPL